MGMINDILKGQCIHCGACTRSCDFLEKYRIDLGSREKMEELAYHCFLCGKCSEVCPEGIDGREEFLGIRRRQVQKNHEKVAVDGYDMLIAEKQNYIFRNYRNITEGSVLFPGCNFPSFYPETTKKLSAFLKKEAGIGTVYDCCGKPIAELGLEEQERKIIDRINKRLREAKVKEIIMLCPNCYYFLKDRLDVRVSGIYEVLKRLGAGRKITGQTDIFIPCPDKKEKLWLSQIEDFLEGKVHVIEDIQCCGLGGCARGKEPDISGGFTEQLKREEYPAIYTYCGSCAGKFARDGMKGVHHVLADVLKIREEPDIARSMINRAKSKFW